MRGLFRICLISSHVFQARLDYGNSLLRILFGWENIPESQGLVSRSCDQCLAIRTRRQIQHSVRVSGQSRHSFHARVFPYVDLILAVAMSGHEFIHVLGEHQVANLTASLNGLERLQLQGIPELNRSVLGSSARGKQALLVR